MINHEIDGVVTIYSKYIHDYVQINSPYSRSLQSNSISIYYWWYPDKIYSHSKSIHYRLVFSVSSHIHFSLWRKDWRLYNLTVHWLTSMILMNEYMVTIMGNHNSLLVPEYNRCHECENADQLLVYISDLSHNTIVLTLYNPLSK